jgi:hypothetical protein
VGPAAPLQEGWHQRVPHISRQQIPDASFSTPPAQLEIYQRLRLPKDYDRNSRPYAARSVKVSYWAATSASMVRISGNTQQI